MFLIAVAVVVGVIAAASNSGTPQTAAGEQGEGVAKGATGEAPAAQADAVVQVAEAEPAEGPRGRIADFGKPAPDEPAAKDPPAAAESMQAEKEAPVASAEQKVSPAGTAKAPGFGGGAKPAFGSMAQFQLPAPAGPTGGPPRPVTQFLTYQYSYGSESDITYRRNRDLDRRRRDDSLILAPQLNGYVLYRPNDDVEMLLEMFLERELPAKEEKTVILPSGEVQNAPKRHTSLAVDQAYVKFKGVGPFDVSVGRRNFEDERHWLYDTSLDAVHARSKWGDFIGEASVARKDRLDGDLFAPVQKTRMNHYMLYGEYRGVEDIKLAGYSIYGEDSSGQEGKPWHLGLRAYGNPSDRFSFWAEGAIVRGKDELKRDLAGRGFDVGLLYRFPDLPLHPSVALGYASGSGDGNPNDNTNREFRQTGLQSNEIKGAGVSKYKYYGEALDPELSNLRIFTASVGFRPAQNVYVDLVYHRYTLNAMADELRNSELTAQMNQDPTQPSKDVGQAFDVVVGLRNLFDIRRLGVDIRAGLFRPGKAFRNEDAGSGTFHKADKSIGAIVKFWW